MHHWRPIKFARVKGGETLPRASATGNPPRHPSALGRDKKWRRVISLSFSLSRMARMAKISPTTASGVPRFMDNLTVCCCIVFEHRSRLFFDSWWIWSGKLSPLVEYRCYYQLFRQGFAFEPWQNVCFRKNVRGYQSPPIIHEFFSSIVNYFLLFSRTFHWLCFYRSGLGLRSLELVKTILRNITRICAAMYRHEKRIFLNDFNSHRFLSVHRSILFYFSLMSALFLEEQSSRAKFP